MSKHVKYIHKVNIYLEPLGNISDLKHSREFTEHVMAKSILPSPCLLFASGLSQQYLRCNNNI